MSQRVHGITLPCYSNSLAIRQEIQRFESVHPSIYTIYDLIEAIPDLLIQQQIREHVVCIEDSFVNSQEWTLSRSVPDLKLGILGTINSGKSALVHRYLTGSYMQEESPEGGRFKKEVIIEGQSHLLLIRDEGGLPEMQFTHWVDAVIFVFSLENEKSFHAIYSFYAKMAHYHGNIQDIPFILVGTQDAISESNPRVIDDTRARKLASDIKRCSYYETCATYGLNVERVFQDACMKIIQSRLSSAGLIGTRSNTPNHSASTRTHSSQQMPGGGKTSDLQSLSSGSGSGSGVPLTPTGSGHLIRGPSPPFQESAAVRDRDRRRDLRERPEHDWSLGQAQFEDPRFRGGHRHGVSVPIPAVPPNPPSHPSPQSFGEAPSGHVTPSQQDNQAFVDFHPVAQLASTPVLPRKLSTVSSGGVTDSVDGWISFKSFMIGRAEDEKKGKNGELGSGRGIPLKQGILYKKSSKPLSKEWKKKYVTLDEGRLTYHPSINDYMENVRGKEIRLMRTTVKIPGQRPKGSEAPKVIQTNGQNVPLSGPELSKDANATSSTVITNPSLIQSFSDLNLGDLPAATAAPKADLPNIKKRPKKTRLGIRTEAGQDTDPDGFDFMIISLDNSTWLFEAQTMEERDEWVSAIEQQILSSLQQNLSEKSKSGAATVTDKAAIQTIRSVQGNSICADCDASNPDWASLNLGVLVCIECSGIHRNLGSHVSRVRSLDLDEWPSDLVVVMTAIGNSLANSIWEANIKGRTKPTPASQREEKEKWVRSKYELKEFVPSPPYLDVPLPQQLIDAVARQDIHNTILVLAYCKPDHVNAPYSKTDTRTALHIAAAMGNLTLVQLLIWYGANVQLIDHEGHNALFYARGSSSVECAELLRGQGCQENPTLPRRRISNPPSNSTGSNEMFDKLPASVI